MADGYLLRYSGGMLPYAGDMFLPLISCFAPLTTSFVVADIGSTRGYIAYADWDLFGESELWAVGVYYCTLVQNVYFVGCVVWA